MEELRSTEVLDREILEDARKKARRILKTAEDEGAQQAAAWEQKTREAVQGIREKYALRIKNYRAEQLARLPLEKRRIRLETIEGFLRGALESFLKKLPRERLLALLGRELGLRASVLREEEKAVSVSYWGLSEAECGALLAAARVLPEGALVLQEGGGKKFPGICLESGAVRVTASIEALGETLLLGKRRELVEALVGPEALKEGAA